MRAGLLTEPIQIIENEIVVNDFGEETSEWVLKYETKARVVHDGGTRTNENDEIYYTGLKTFEVRFYVPITDFDRIVWNGTTYRILNIDPNKEKQKLTIRAEKVND